MIRNGELKLVDKTVSSNYVLRNGKEVSLTTEGIELFNSNLTPKQLEALTEQVLRQME
jgi:hypothetical protein